MNRNNLKYFSVGALTLLISLMACNRPPDLPLAPSIGYEDVVFEVSSTNIGAVVIETFALKLTFSVSDGDGDIGLDGAESGRPYQEFDLVRDEVTRQPVVFGERPQDPPFNCLDWLIESPVGVPPDAAFDYNGDGDKRDTVLVNFNPNRFNMFVDFFIKQPDGSFVESDVRTWPPGSINEQTFCNTETFDGRIPCLSSADEPCDFVRSTKRPIEGSITYEMISSGFLPVFRTSTIKMVFQIQDRALNKSNIVETPEFTLQDIRVETTGG